MTNDERTVDPGDDASGSDRNAHIGDQGEIWFAGQLPCGWVWQPPRRDLGKDGLIVIRDHSDLHNLEFSVQVKTSERPVIQGQFVVKSGVSRSSVMYWFASPLPTLVVAVDLLERRAWYSWHLDLFESPAELFRSDQKTVTIRIPERNHLNEEGWTEVRRDLKQHFASLRDAVNDASSSSRLLPMVNGLVRSASNLLKLAKIPPPNRGKLTKEAGMTVFIEQLEHRNVLSVVRSLVKHVRTDSSAAHHLQAWIDAYEATVLSAYPNLNAIPENGPYGPDLELAFAPKKVLEIRPRLVETALDMVMWLTSRPKPGDSQATNDQSQLPHEAAGVVADEPLMSAFRRMSGTVKLTRVTVTELGCAEGATTRQILGAEDNVDSDRHLAPFTAGRGCELGLELCSAEVGPYLRLEYKDQPVGERLFVAMKPIHSSDGEPRIFVVEHNDQGMSLDAARARPDDIWQPSDIFVFSTGEAS
jgi:hypothetical protein